MSVLTQLGSHAILPQHLGDDLIHDFSGAAWIDRRGQREIVHVLNATPPMFQAQRSKGSLHAVTVGGEAGVGAGIHQHPIAVDIVPARLTQYIVVAIKVAKCLCLLKDVGLTGVAIIVVIVRCLPVEPAVNLLLVLGPGDHAQRYAIVLGGKGAGSRSVAVVQIKAFVGIRLVAVGSTLPLVGDAHGHPGCGDVEGRRVRCRRG